MPSPTSASGSPNSTSRRPGSSSSQASSPTARVLLSAEGRAVKALAGGDLRYGFALELGELTDRLAERQQGGDRVIVGDAEQRLDPRLLCHRRCGQHATVALVSRG